MSTFSLSFVVVAVKDPVRKKKKKNEEEEREEEEEEEEEEKGTSITTMYLHEKQDSFSPLRQLLHHVSQRRYRNYAAVAVALLLLSMVWLSGRLTTHYYYNSSRQTWPDGYSFAGAGSGSLGQQQQQQQQQQSRVGSGAAGAQGRHLIPPNIWQIVLPKAQPYRWDLKHVRIDPRQLENTASWLAMNPDWQ